MDEAVNSGSFMAPAGGGGSALAEAMARRSQGGPGVANQSTQSPQAVPPTQVPQNSPSAMPPTSQGAGLPVGQPESQIILRALNQRLQHLSKIEEGQSGVVNASQ